MASLGLLHAVACVCIANAVITLIVYERIVAQNEASTGTSAGARTAEEYFASHGGMEALMAEKFGPANNGKNKKIEREGFVTDQNQQKKHNDDQKPIPAYRRRRRRFPEYGTPEFSALCPWADDTTATSSRVSKAATPPLWRQHNDELIGKNCTFLVRPRSGSNEGIASWTSEVVKGHLRVAQTSCNLLIDYGKYHVDVSSVVHPYQGQGMGDTLREVQRYNWTAPFQFQCDKRNGCYENGAGWSYNKGVLHAGVDHMASFDLARVPSYRHAYVGLLPKERLRAEDYLELRRRLEGFREEIGFACSLGKLFHLSPSVSQFEPRLYTEILPTLKDEDALVLSLYIRTGFTDRQATNDEKKEGPAPDTMQTGATNSATRRNVKCALAVEKELLSYELEALDSGKGKMPKYIVWMVVSDSTAAKEWLRTIYGDKVVEAVSSDGTKQSIGRKVLFTGSRGAHTKPRHDPSTADFADAFIDWYLIAESDVVITTGGLYSFGITAGLRTARPIYGAKVANETCVKEGGGVECSCTPLYDESERIGSLLDEL